MAKWSKLSHDDLADNAELSDLHFSNVLMFIQRACQMQIQF